MTTLDLSTTVGRLVADRPDRARFFQNLGIDCGYGGKVPLGLACSARGLDPGQVVRELHTSEARASEAETDDYFPSTMGELTDFLLATHHAYLRLELPRLAALAGKVADAHGSRHPALLELSGLLLDLRGGIEAHLDQEERVLFPRIKRLEAALGQKTPGPSVTALIRALDREHDEVGSALVRLRSLTAPNPPSLETSPT
jgi:regulator of cell morphogenesis and NO signaling